MKIEFRVSEVTVGVYCGSTSGSYPVGGLGGVGGGG